MTNYFQKRQRRSLKLIRSLFRNYENTEENLNLSYKKMFLDIIEKNLVICETKKYDVLLYRDKLIKIRNNLEGILE